MKTPRRNQGFPVFLLIVQNVVCHKQDDEADPGKKRATIQ